MMDVLASWALLSRRDKTEFKRGRIFFVIRVNPPYLEDEELVSKIQFLNFAYNMRYGKFNVSNDDLTKLVSLHFMMDYEEWNESYSDAWMK